MARYGNFRVNEYCRVHPVLSKKRDKDWLYQEEVARFRQGFINKEQLHKIADPLVKGGYGKYLIELM